MTDANTICHDVDLLGDWLSAKGYTEEAGLCLRVLGLIHEQAEENEKLRAALKPFTKRQPKDAPDNQTVWVETTVKNLRAAAKAYRETEECSTSST